MPIESKFSYRMYTLYPIIIIACVLFICTSVLSFFMQVDLAFEFPKEAGWRTQLIYLIILGIVICAMIYGIGLYKQIVITEDQLYVTSPYYNKREFTKKNVVIELGYTRSKVRSEIKYFRVIHDKQNATFIEDDYKNYMQMVKTLRENGYLFKGNCE